MALIECPECKKEISDKAKECPHCGYPIVKKEEKKKQETKKRFSSKKYKYTGFICSIPCALILLLFLLGITFNSIGISLLISLVYGVIIYLLSKYLLNTKQHIKKFAWLVILFIALPLLISLFLLTKNEDWVYQDASTTNEIQFSAIGLCKYKYKNPDIDVTSKTCTFERTEKQNPHIKYTNKFDNEQEVHCVVNDKKMICSDSYSKRSLILDKK
jgi:hypothetical protein